MFSRRTFISAERVPRLCGWSAAFVSIISGSQGALLLLQTTLRYKTPFTLAAHELVPPFQSGCREFHLKSDLKWDSSFEITHLPLTVMLLWWHFLSHISIVVMFYMGKEFHPVDAYCGHGLHHKKTSDNKPRLRAAPSVSPKCPEELKQQH